MLKTSKKAESLPLAQLQTNPLQGHYYAAAPLAEDEELRRDLAANGQRDPIVVVPVKNKKYLILDGHRRAHLLAELGATHAIAIIRRDLAADNEDVLEREFLRFNFSRRQLCPLDKAVVARRLYELERGKPLNRCENQADARDHVGALIGMSGRNLDRYWRLLRTPRPVQLAFREGLLTLELASRVDGLAALAQAEAAAEVAQLAILIDSAKNERKEQNRLRRLLRQAIEKRVGEQRAASRSTARAYCAFAAALRRTLPGMTDAAESVRPDLIQENLPQLEEALCVLNRLVSRGQAAP